MMVPSLHFPSFSTLKGVSSGDALTSPPLLSAFLHLPGNTTKTYKLL